MFNSGSAYVFESKTVGINKSNLNLTILVFPNPFNNTFTVAIPSHQQDKSITVLTATDLIGRNIFSRVVDITNGNFDVDASGWKSGIYFLSLQSENGVWRAKLVKE